MRTNLSGPNIAAAPGEIVEIDAETAAVWLNEGFAEAVKQSPETATSGPVDFGVKLGGSAKADVSKAKPEPEPEPRGETATERARTTPPQKKVPRKRGRPRKKA